MFLVSDVNSLVNLLQVVRCKSYREGTVFSHVKPTTVSTLCNVKDLRFS